VGVLAEKYCPDCGELMVNNGVGAWKCPAGCGEWLRNEEEAPELPKTPTQKQFQPLTEGLMPMHWRTPAKPVLQGGAIEFSGSSNCKSRKPKKKPARGFLPWQIT